jgi:hypothetical protein
LLDRRSDPIVEQQHRRRFSEIRHLVRLVDDTARAAPASTAGAATQRLIAAHTLSVTAAAVAESSEIAGADGRLSLLLLLVLSE